MDWGCAVGLKFRENGEEIYLVCKVAIPIDNDRNRKEEDQEYTKARNTTTNNKYTDSAAVVN